MKTRTRKLIAAGLLATVGGIVLGYAFSRAAPKMMRRMMHSMMKEMMNGENGFDPPEMCRKMMAEFAESE